MLQQYFGRCTRGNPVFNELLSAPISYLAGNTIDGAWYTVSGYAIQLYSQALLCISRAQDTCDMRHTILFNMKKKKHEKYRKP